MNEEFGECWIFAKPREAECHFVVIPQTPLLERLTGIEHLEVAMVIAGAIILGLILGRFTK